MISVGENERKASIYFVDTSNGHLIGLGST